MDRLRLANIVATEPAACVLEGGSHIRTNDCVWGVVKQSMAVSGDFWVSKTMARRSSGCTPKRGSGYYAMISLFYMFRLTDISLRTLCRTG
jgi:hypothetical protein